MCELGFTAFRFKLCLSARSVHFLRICALSVRSIKSPCLECISFSFPTIYIKRSGRREGQWKLGALVESGSTQVSPVRTKDPLNRIRSFVNKTSKLLPKKNQILSGREHRSNKRSRQITACISRFWSSSCSHDKSWQRPGWEMSSASAHWCDCDSSAPPPHVCLSVCNIRECSVWFQMCAPVCVRVCALVRTNMCVLYGLVNTAISETNIRPL